MIFVSTSCLKHNKIKDSVQQLSENGFKNIELSGGTEFYESFEDDLLELKDKHNLNYRCHNYFPPPKNPFVLNLASLNDETFNKSFDHLFRAIDLSKRLGAKKYGFHAGFFIDIKLNEIGKKLSIEDLFDKDKAIERFCNAYNVVKKKTNNPDLFIENNVFSKSNYDTFKGNNPFMMTSFKDYEYLKQKIDFNLLLDVAHLKVSANSLSLNWHEEFEKMIDVSNYIHISDNDGFHDQNKQFTETSELYQMLKKNNTVNKDFTLEIYEDIEKIKISYEALSKAIL
jgi:sugar phosphate isomerase/epimerase